MHFPTPLLVLPAAVVVYEIISRLVARLLWNKLSVMKDIPLLSKERPKDKKFSGTAIICGGSIAGLIAAKVCANHFEKVIIVEPEEWVAVGDKGLKDIHREPDAPKRSRVAQYEAFHFLQAIITVVMKEMFPTFEQEHERLGGRLKVTRDFYYASGVPRIISPRHPFFSGGAFPPIISLSRPAFETTLRRLVLETCRGVQFFHGTVTGLVYDEMLNRASGVNVKLSSGKTIELEGNLVVDATGSFMGGHRWLKAIPKYANYHSPSLDDCKISFDPKVSYTIAEFALPPEIEEAFRQYGLGGDVGSDTSREAHGYLPADGGSENMFGLDVRDKNFLQIGCGGYGWRGKIRSVSDIEEHIRDLPWKRPLPKWILDVLHTLQSEDVPAEYVDYRFPHSAHIKYHEIKDLPSNFVVVGDAQSQTDPILGQGCAKACATGIILNAQLHRSSPDSVGYLPRTFAKRYFLDVQGRTGHVWENMKNIDYNFPSTVPLPGEDPKTHARFIRTYGDILFALTTKDTDISDAFGKQVGWLAPPTDTLAPWVVRRVAWAWIKQTFGYEIL